MNDEAQKAFAAWVNQKHPNGKSLADVFEPAFGMIAENAWADAWQAATLTERERCAALADKGFSSCTRIESLFLGLMAEKIRRSDA